MGRTSWRPVGTERIRRPEPKRRRTGRLALAALASAVLLGGCTEDPLTGPGPAEGEEESARTVELVLGPGEMQSWRDTTFTGFALPSDAGFLVLAAGDAFRSRGLVRYPELPDSVEIDEETLEVAEFLDGEVRIVTDTALSSPPPGGLTLRISTLARSFEPDEADWQQAAEGRPWDAAGGDFDREVGRLRLEDVDRERLADTLTIPLGGSTDSLLTAWRESDGQPGLAVVVETDGARLHARSAHLEFEVRPAGSDTTVRFAAGSELGSVPSTSIFDPPPPPPGQALRVGGLPAARFYVAFRPPTRVDDVRLTGGTINRAEIVFPPAAAPPAPFALPGAVTGSGLRLLGDPFSLGPRTPVGDTLATGTVPLDPDSLGASRPLRFEFTDQLRAWASDPDSAGDLRAGVRLRPDAQTAGFWEFGSEASAEPLRPFLRVVVTPPGDTGVP